MGFKVGGYAIVVSDNGKPWAHKIPLHSRVKIVSEANPGWVVERPVHDPHYCIHGAGVIASVGLFEHELTPADNLSQLEKAIYGIEE